MVTVQTSLREKALIFSINVEASDWLRGWRGDVCVRMCVRAHPRVLYRQREAMLVSPYPIWMQTVAAALATLKISSIKHKCNNPETVVAKPHFVHTFMEGGRSLQQSLLVCSRDVSYGVFV